MTLPLAHITVVSLEHAIAAPFCTRQLADLGARVIKVERPGVGDFARAYDERVHGLASHFVWVNRGKESLALDLKDPAALDILMRLIAKADVLVQNLAPGAAARMGLSAEALRPTHPGLIVCDISGYGGDGPYRDKKAYDLLIQSEAGFLSVTGSGDEPAKAGNSIADIAAGMYAYTSILAALYARDTPGPRAGLGSHIDVSMLESLVEWMGYPLYYAFDGATAPLRSGAEHATIYPYGPFRGRRRQDGDARPAERTRVVAVLPRRARRRDGSPSTPRFASNSQRHRNRDALRALILDVFASLTAAEIVTRLDAAQIANARMNTMGEVWAHPQLAARDRWRDVGTPAGPVPAPLPPGRHDGFEYRMGDVPALGQHTDAILRELGLASTRTAS